MTSSETSKRQISSFIFIVKCLNKVLLFKMFILFQKQVSKITSKTIIIQGGLSSTLSSPTIFTAPSVPSLLSPPV